MKTLVNAAVALSIGAAALLPTFASAQAVRPAGASEAAIIADLTGRTYPLFNAAAYHLDPLPAGESYAYKDSRIVVVSDATGQILHIVRVVADLSTPRS